MNNQQRVFCQEYVKNGNNGSEAYMKAYPNIKKENARINASRLLTKVNIQHYIKELQEQLEDDAIMETKDIMKWLSDVVRDIERENVYIKDNSGLDTLVGNKNADLNTKMKAIDLLNKMRGAYTQKVEVQGDMKLNNPFREMSTDEIIELINNEK